MEDAINNLNQNGFAVVDDFIDRSTITNTIEAVEAIPDDAMGPRVRRGVAFARRNLLNSNLVRALMTRPQVRQLCDAFSTPLTAVRAILFDKNRFANWTVPWHQDRSIAVLNRIDVPGFGPWSEKAGVVHVQPPAFVLKQMLTLRFHLDPCGADNGPLRVIAGSHHRILPAKDLDKAVANGVQTPCRTTGGGLVLMRPLILHASSPAKAPSHRRVIHVELGPPELPGGLRWALA